MLDRERVFGIINMKGVQIHLYASPWVNGNGLMFDANLFAEWVSQIRLENLVDGEMRVTIPPVPDKLAASAVLIRDVWTGEHAEER